MAVHTSTDPEELPRILHSAKALHEHLQAFLTDSDRACYHTVVVESRDVSSTRISIHLPKRRSLHYSVCKEMLRLGYVMVGLEDFDNVHILTFNKLDCDVQLDTTERGLLVVKGKMFKLVD